MQVNLFFLGNLLTSHIKIDDIFRNDLRIKTKFIEETYLKMIC